MSEKSQAAYINFLIQVLKETENSQGKPQALYPLLRENLDKLDDTLVQILKDWTNQILFSVPSDQALMSASTLGNFGLLLQQCPFGDRAINLEIAMTACQQALKVFTPGIIPQRRAAIQSILGITYGDRIRGERAKNLELAIDYYQEALQVITPNTSPGLWAATYNNLGKAYLDRIQGEPEDNLEMAISCFQNSLQVFTKDNFPVDWAMSQRNLGSAFYRRIHGDQAENYEQGIQCYQNALRVYTYPEFPQQSAEIQKCLGTAYFYRILGDQEKNLELAISCYQNAIRIFTQNAFPENWANIQVLLGNAYRKRIRGEPASNFEQAIACYKKALQVYTQDIYPEQWAIIQKILEEENQAKNLEQVMPLHLIKALVKAPTLRQAQWIVEQHEEELLDKKIDPFLQSLANNQQDERTGRKLEEIRAVLARCREVGIAPAYEEKIAAVIAEEPGRKREQPDFDSMDISAEQAVQLLTAMVTNDVTLWRTNPELVGIGLNQESLKHLLRRYPDLSVILGQPSSQFEIVEEGEPVEIPPDFQEEISELQRVEAARGFRSPEVRVWGYPEHLSYSIKVYERILKQLKSDEYPLFRALILFNLGINYLELPIGDRLYNLRKVIEYCQKALPLRNPDITPINYGLTLSTLGLAYSELSRISSEFGVTQAISYFHEARQFLNPNIAPRGYGMTLTNLGELYRNLPGGLEDNLTQAIKFYKEALRVYKPETAPLKYALTKHNLGIAYGELPTNRQENLKEAIECLKKTLRFRTPALPLEYASSLHNLGVAYSELSNELPNQKLENIDQAINYSKEALRFYTPDTAPFNCRLTAILLGDLYCKQEKWDLAYDAYDLAHRAAELMYSSAFIPISQQEEIKINTALCDRLVNICLQLRDNQDFARKALVYAESGKARTFLDQMGQGNFPLPPGVPEHRLKEEQALLDQLHQKEQQLVSTKLSIAKIEEYAKEHQKIKTQLEKFWDTLSCEYPEAQEYVNLRRAKSPTWEELTQLASSLGEEVALVEFYILEDKIAVFILRAGWEKPHIFVLPISRQVFFHRYFQSYQKEVWQYKEEYERHGLEAPVRNHRWLELGKDLLAPLESALESAQLVYFVPHDLLHVMPLHALKVEGEPFISRYAVTYAPSMAVLARTLQNTLKSRADASALVMGYEPKDNPDFLEEAKAVASQFGCHPYLGSDANIHTLCEYAPTAHHIHLSCHGAFGKKNSLDSFVKLADGPFKARQWMGLKLQTDLVTLSACQTGINEVGRGDEIVGLSRALLYAGASSVLLTLWSVNAESTKEWMLDFYQQTWSSTKGKLKAEAFAFQQATLELRKKYPNDPSHWAAFILVGDWR